MREITHAEAFEIMLNGGTVYGLEKVNTYLPIGELMNMRLFVDEGTELRAKVDKIIATANGAEPNPDPKPKEAPKRAVKGSKEKTTKRKPVDYGRVDALLKAGWSKQAVADDCGCSYQSVCNYDKKRREGEGRA